MTATTHAPPTRERAYVDLDEAAAALGCTRQTLTRRRRELGVRTMVHPGDNRRRVILADDFARMFVPRPPRGES